MRFSGRGSSSWQGGGTFVICDPRGASSLSALNIVVSGDIRKARENAGVVKNVFSDDAACPTTTATVTCHMMSHPFKGKRKSGVGMIEVLVAVIVMSIGFLAVAQMQIRGMRNNQSTYLRSQAAMMLKDMTDRMRSNRVGVKGSSYDSLTTTNDKTLPDCVTNKVSCTPAELAAKDIYEWSVNIYPPAAMTNAVPAFPATGAIGKVTNNSGVFDVVVQWTELIDGTSEAQSMTVQFMP